MTTNRKQAVNGIACKFTVVEPVMALEKFQKENGVFNSYPVSPVDPTNSREYVSTRGKHGFTHVTPEGNKFAWHAALLSVAISEGKITAFTEAGLPAKVGDTVAKIVPPVKMGRDDVGRMLV